MSQSFSPVLSKTVTPTRLAARWPLYRNPVRLAVSASPWRAAGYLAGFLACNYLVVATARARTGAR
jgi:hypothetical protein